MFGNNVLLQMRNNHKNLILDVWTQEKDFIFNYEKNNKIYENIFWIKFAPSLCFILKNTKSYLYVLSRSKYIATIVQD